MVESKKDEQIDTKYTKEATRDDSQQIFFNSNTMKQKNTYNALAMHLYYVCKGDFFTITGIITFSLTAHKLGLKYYCYIHIYKYRIIPKIQLNPRYGTGLFYSGLKYFN